jgi:periplasmic mercuric ion binding protein
MKTFRISLIMALSIAIAHFSFGQKTTTETIPVAGNCGMCKNTIEKAAKSAGASNAVWDMDAKKLEVTYSSSSTSAQKIQQSIAAAGYDTRDFKGNDKAYDKLHACCKYERIATAKAACCDLEKCGKSDDCCKGLDCCKDAKCEMPKKVEKQGAGLMLNPLWLSAHRIAQPNPDL